MEKTYKFTSDMIVQAKNEKEAKEFFADNSLDFAGNAECTQICEKHFEPILFDTDNECKRCNT